MNYIEFNIDEHGEEIVWAVNTAAMIKNGVIVFPFEKELESIFLIDEHFNFFDISLVKTPVSVHTDLSRWHDIAYKHILVHNHPNGFVWPSDADWRHESYLSTLSTLCAFQMIYGVGTGLFSMYKRRGNKRFFKLFQLWLKTSSFSFWLYTSPFSGVTFL